MKAGQFASRLAGKDITVSPRPSSPFVESMPRQFRDTFPSLLSRFTGKPPQPKRDHEVTYSEIQPWLTIGQAWRKGFVKRFQARLNDPAFRKALESHLKDHPEWGPLVHPELYQQKTSPTATGNPDPKNRRYLKMKLIMKVNLVLLLVFALGFLSVGYLTNRLLQRNAKQEILENARIMMEAALAVRSYTSAEINPLLKTQMKYFFPAAVGARILSERVLQTIAAKSFLTTPTKRQL